MEVGADWSSDPAIQWSTVILENSEYVYYILPWTGAKVNGNAINGVTFGSAIIDSGTTLALLEQSYLTALFNMATICIFFF